MAIVPLLKDEAAVPLLKDEAAKSFLKKLSDSKLQSYTDAQRKETDKKVEAIISKRKITNNQLRKVFAKRRRFI